MKKIITTLSMALFALTLSAIPAQKGIKKIIQLADGKTIEVELRGDEHYHWYADANGNNYELDGITGLYKQMSTFAVPEKVKRIKEENEQRRAEKIKRTRFGGINVFKGEKPALVILVEFSDLSFQAANDLNKFKGIIAGDNYTEGNFYGSVKDYFKDQSLNQFIINFDVVGPVKLDETAEYYGKNDPRQDVNAPQMIVDAARKADKDGLVNDWKQYDWDGDGEIEQVYFLYAGKGEASGGGENTIWPHEWTLRAGYGQRIPLGGVYLNTYSCGQELNRSNRLDGIGTMCHEYSHCLGLPDFYNTEDSNDFGGMGEWDVMNSGSYNQGSFSPAGYTAYERMCCGWITPIELTDDKEVKDLKTVQAGGESYIVYNQGNKNEYYIVENRQRESWDRGLPGNGLSIIHVDFLQSAWTYNSINTDKKHRRFALKRANNSNSENGLYNDLYPNGTRDSLTQTSVPNTATFNKNIDGSSFMNVSFTNIAKTANKTVAFNFKTVKLPYVINLSETFDKCGGTGGNDGSWSGNIAYSAFSPDLDGWTTTYKYGGNKCARFGNSTKAVTLTSPTFEIAGETDLTFLVGLLSTATQDQTMVLSVSPGFTISPSSITMNKGSWTSYKGKITGTGNVQITFKTATQILLDEVNAKKDNTSSGIETVETIGRKVNDNKIYSIDGRYVGEDFNVLTPGIYIINGKKVVK